MYVYDTVHLVRKDAQGSGRAISNRDIISIYIYAYYVVYILQY